MSDVVDCVRAEVWSLFPEVSEDLAGTYRTRGWIFPNHFEPMIKIAKGLCLKYGGDEEICKLACFLHDTGLVYKRTDLSPVGHESNSLEFARVVLGKYGVEADRVDLILRCIAATEVDFEPGDVNEKIVRSADILSQFYSVHFFAKAHFYPDWKMYLDFLEKKVERGFDKICFEDEVEEVRPIRDYFRFVLSEYRKYNSD